MKLTSALLIHDNTLFFTIAYLYGFHESSAFRESIRTAISVPKYPYDYEVSSVCYIRKHEITACIAGCLAS